MTAALLMPDGDRRSQCKVTDLYQLSIWSYKSTDASFYLGSVFWCEAYEQNQCTSTDNNFVFEKGKITKSSLLFQEKNQNQNNNQQQHSTLDLGHVGFFLKAVSRPVNNIWNLKCTYEPAGLMFSAGNFYSFLMS